MRRRIFLALVVTSLLVGLVACGVKEIPPNATVQQEISPAVPEDLPPEARAAYESLNSGYAKSLDLTECPNRYRDHPVSYSGTGETEWAIEIDKEKLKELGYTVRWNCHEMKYEIAEDGTAVCDCPPAPFTTNTP